MPLEFIEHSGIKYPKFQSEGNAARWIMPLAQYYLSGVGLDIGYCKEEWKFPNAIGIEPTIDYRYDAMCLPPTFDEYDFIFNSHVLEHIKENYYVVLDYWLSKIKIGGILFMYLPHKSQTYWKSISNRKHVHEFDGSEIGDYLKSLGHKVFVGGCDHNNSFVVICEKTKGFPVVKEVGEAMSKIIKIDNK
jgi:hypothetical protein